MSDESLFCPSCGFKTEIAQPSNGTAPKTTGKAPLPRPKIDPSTSEGKKKIGILAGAAAAVLVVVIAVAVFAINAGKVSADIVEQDLKNSSIVASGITSSSYLDESAYELTDFKLVSQEKQSLELFGMRQDVQYVTFEGTIKNNNFETQFSGDATYTKNGDSWMLGISPSVLTHTTTPLKGVDNMGLSKNEDDSENVSFSDFNATLDENGGSYTSDASVTATQSFWFADDVSSLKATFTFDNDSGWTPRGDIQASDTKTSWKLKDTSFTLTDGGMFVPSGSYDCTLKFTDDADGNVSADYTFNFTPNNENDVYNTYTPVNLGGTVTGTMSHKFGENDFSVELNDAGNAVTLECRNTSAVKVAGAGTVNAIKVNADTHSVYRTSQYGRDGIVSGDFTYTQDV